MSRLAPSEALALDLERIARELAATAERHRGSFPSRCVRRSPVERTEDLADRVRALAHELAPDLVKR